VDSDCDLSATKLWIKLGKIGLYLVNEVEIFRILEKIIHVKPNNPLSFY
jgi:hypothetical protein